MCMTKTRENIKMLEEYTEKIKNEFTRGKFEEVIEVYANKHTSQRHEQII